MISQYVNVCGESTFGGVKFILEVRSTRRDSNKFLAFKIED
jgi:hypothetical protein